MFVSLLSFEQTVIKKGTLGQKRRPKGDPNLQKGPLGDPGTLKGTQLGTVDMTHHERYLNVH